MAKSKDELFREVDDHLCKAYLAAQELEMKIADHQERYTFKQLVIRRLELTMMHAIKIKGRVMK